MDIPRDSSLKVSGGVFCNHEPLLGIPLKVSSRVCCNHEPLLGIRPSIDSEMQAGKAVSLAAISGRGPRRAAFMDDENRPGGLPIRPVLDGMSDFSFVELGELCSGELSPCTQRPASIATIHISDATPLAAPSPRVTAADVFPVSTPIYQPLGAQPSLAKRATCPPGLPSCPSTRVERPFVAIGPGLAGERRARLRMLVKSFLWARALLKHRSPVFIGLVGSTAFTGIGCPEMAVAALEHAGACNMIRFEHFVDRMFSAAAFWQ